MGNGSYLNIDTTPVWNTSVWPGLANDGNHTKMSHGFVNMHFEFYIFFLVFREFEALAAVIGNTITIFIVLKYEFLRTNTNYLIVSLAIADVNTIWNAIFGPLTDGPWFDCNADWQIFCVLRLFMETINSAGNLYSILLISIDRFLYISYPLRYEIFVTRARVVWTLVGVWVWVVLNAMLIIPYYNIDGHTRLCATSAVVPSIIETAFYLPGFAIVSTITAAMYSRIAYIAYRRSRDCAGTSSGVSNRSNKILRMLSLVLGLYFLLWLPALVMFSFLSADSPGWLVELYHMVALLWFVNSWINPFIYAWHSSEFRRGFRKFFGMKNFVDPIQVSTVLSNTDWTVSIT